MPSNNDNRPDKIIELVSAHEIGHALIAYLFNDMFDLQRVTINSNKNGAGGYHYLLQIIIMICFLQKNL